MGRVSRYLRENTFIAEPLYEDGEAEADGDAEADPDADGLALALLLAEGSPVIVVVFTVSHSRIPPTETRMHSLSRVRS